MSAQLSKLHVRFIQSQKEFSLLNAQKEQKRVPLSQLYVKDDSHFYLAMVNDRMENEEKITLCFDEATAALKRLQCGVTKEEIAKESEEYDDALLFFNMDSSQDISLFLLHIDAIEEQ